MSEVLGTYFRGLTGVVHLFQPESVDEIGFFIIGCLLAQGGFGKLFFLVIVFLALVVDSALVLRLKLQRANLHRLLCRRIQ